MSTGLENAVEILERLVGFQSYSGRPTHEIVGYIQNVLTEQGVEVTLSYANVFATIGPEVDGGVVLNGHTDVVSVEGQAWSSDPFQLTRKGDRLFGRGSVDMKGFRPSQNRSISRFPMMKKTAVTACLSCLRVWRQRPIALKW